MASRRSESAPTPAKQTAKTTGKASARRTPRRTKRVAPPATVTEEIRLGMIAEAAYFNAERRGFAPGGEVEDWLAAESEVDALLKVSLAMPQ